MTSRNCLNGKSLTSANSASCRLGDCCLSAVADNQNFLLDRRADDRHRHAAIVPIYWFMRALSVTTIFVLASFPAMAADSCGPGHLLKAEVRSGVLELVWQGSVSDQMAADIAGEFAKHRRHASSVSLSLHSYAGSLRYMQRAIAVLEQIQGTHQVITKVERVHLRVGVRADIPRRYSAHRSTHQLILFPSGCYRLARRPRD